jgi:hypothetical protein
LPLRQQAQILGNKKLFYKYWETKKLFLQILGNKKLFYKYWETKNCFTNTGKQKTVLPLRQQAQMLKSQCSAISSAYVRLYPVPM